MNAITLLEELGVLGIEETPKRPRPKTLPNVSNTDDQNSDNLGRGQDLCR